MRKAILLLIALSLASPSRGVDWQYYSAATQDTCWRSLAMLVDTAKGIKSVGNKVASYFPLQKTLLIGGLATAVTAGGLAGGLGFYHSLRRSDVKQTLRYPYKAIGYNDQWEQEFLRDNAPYLVQLLGDPDVSEQVVTRFRGAPGVRPPELVPLLIENLSSGHAKLETVNSVAILKLYGPPAQAAIPAILKLNESYRDKHPALAAIDPGLSNSEVRKYFVEDHYNLGKWRAAGSPLLKMVKPAMTDETRLTLLAESASFAADHPVSDATLVRTLLDPIRDSLATAVKEKPELRQRVITSLLAKDAVSEPWSVYPIFVKLNAETELRQDIRANPLKYFAAESPPPYPLRDLLSDLIPEALAKANPADTIRLNYFSAEPALVQRHRGALLELFHRVARKAPNGYTMSRVLYVLKDTELTEDETVALIPFATGPYYEPIHSFLKKSTEAVQQQAARAVRERLLASKPEDETVTAALHFFLEFPQLADEAVVKNFMTENRHHFKLRFFEKHLEKALPFAAQIGKEAIEDAAEGSPSLELFRRFPADVRRPIIDDLSKKADTRDFSARLRVVKFLALAGDQSKDAPAIQSLVEKMPSADWKLNLNSLLRNEKIVDALMPYWPKIFAETGEGAYYFDNLTTEQQRALNAAYLAAYRADPKGDWMRSWVRLQKRAAGLPPEVVTGVMEIAQSDSNQYNRVSAIEILAANLGYHSEQVVPFLLKRLSTSELESSSAVHEAAAIALMNVKSVTPEIVHALVEAGKHKNWKAAEILEYLRNQR